MSLVKAGAPVKSKSLEVTRDYKEEALAFRHKWEAKGWKTLDYEINGDSAEYIFYKDR